MFVCFIYLRWLRSGDVCLSATPGPILLCQVSPSIFYFLGVGYHVCHTLILISFTKFNYADVCIPRCRLRDLRCGPLTFNFGIRVQLRPDPRRAPLLWVSISNSTTLPPPPLAFVSFVSFYFFLFLSFFLYLPISFPLSLSLALFLVSPSLSFSHSLFSLFFFFSFLPFSPSFSSFV